MADNPTINGVPIAGDDIGGIVHQLVGIEYGPTDSLVRVTTTAPLPTREPIKASALSKGGITSSSASQQVVTSNTSRTVIEVSNAGANGVWLAFGASAVAGQGTYLPSKATGYWPTTAAVNCINESSGANGAIGYTEW